MDEELQGLRKFYSYIMDLHGQGLEVANWHRSGELEALDNFLEEADNLVGVTVKESE